MKNKVTSLSFGLGLQSEAKRDDAIQKHLDAMNEKGWHLIDVEGGFATIPVTWRFYWETSVERTS